MNKTIVFITKSLCYHQVYLADELFKIYGNSFSFIQVREPLEFRVRNNQEGFERAYLKRLGRTKDERREALNLLRNADVIISGEVPYRFQRIYNKKALLLMYSERIFKSDLRLSLLQRFKRCLYWFLIRFFPRCKNRFLLSAGVFSVLDYNRIGLFKNKAYVWGYFPRFAELDFDELFEMKEHDYLDLVWCSRLLPFKHPEKVIVISKYLKERNIKFVFHVIGDGDEKEGDFMREMIDLINCNHLNDCVILHGKARPDEVFDFYKKCNIALFTSSDSEGWGVGINEAMNFGCVVVSSDSIGSACYMIKNNINGMTYQFGNDSEMLQAIESLINDKEKRNRLGAAAYKTILNLWNYRIAARRLADLIGALSAGKETPYLDGPCSKVNLGKEIIQ